MTAASIFNVFSSMLNTTLVLILPKPIVLKETRHDSKIELEINKPNNVPKLFNVKETIEAFKTRIISWLIPPLKVTNSFDNCIQLHQNIGECNKYSFKQNVTFRITNFSMAEYKNKREKLSTRFHDLSKSIETLSLYNFNNSLDVILSKLGNELDDIQDDLDMLDLEFKLC